MRLLCIFLLVGWTVVTVPGAQGPEARLREVWVVARTNPPSALRLCDQIAADFPTNAQPLAVRARLLEHSRRYPDALKDLNAAIKLDAISPPLWQLRGEVHFKMGRFKESVADFDRYLEMAPAQAPYHWQRGISLYYAGRFADGRKQFESHRTVNPNDVENAAWHFLCAARESGITNARAAMLPVGKDGRAPMTEIDALYRGTGSIEQVVTAATRAMSDSRQENALFYAELYLGLYFEVMGDAARARDHLTKAATMPGSTHYMGDVARVHLQTLKASR